MADSGDVDGAIKDYTQAVKYNPNYSLAFNNRGTARASKGDHGGAIADYTRALEISPNYATALSNRGIAFEALGNMKNACLDWKSRIWASDSSNGTRINARSKKEQRTA